MTATDHDRLLGAWGEMINANDWDRLGELVQPDAILEYPQSGERFRGIANIRRTFEDYPDRGVGSTQVDEVIGSPTAYALTPSYTLVGVDGSGDRGAAVSRVHYPDDTWWWGLILYEVRDGLLDRIRTYFAQDFDPPDWRAPFREAP
jgi:hypothetical protein